MQPRRKQPCITRQQRAQLRWHQQHRVFPRRFHLLFHLWHRTLELVEHIRIDRHAVEHHFPALLRLIHHVGQQIFQLIIQGIHRQLLLANERMGNAAPQRQAHISCQQNMIFGHRATGDQHGGDGDDIAQGNAFGQQRPVHFQQLAVIERRA